MSREHGAYHFEEESQNFLRKPSSSNQYTRFWTYISKREIDPILIIIGLLLGILLTLCVIAIIGLFHHVFFHQSRQLEVKLEESQLNGDELMKCKRPDRDSNPDFLTTVQVYYYCATEAYN
uniref:Uncharacterized protein n=1 Tax=Acrobeloides nanus TaxID=290746 RepID=A0A914CD70_9BILA